MSTGNGNNSNARSDEELPPSRSPLDEIVYNMDSEELVTEFTSRRPPANSLEGIELHPLDLQIIMRYFAQSDDHESFRQLMTSEDLTVSSEVEAVNENSPEQNDQPTNKTNFPSEDKKEEKTIKNASCIDESNTTQKRKRNAEQDSSTDDDQDGEDYPSPKKQRLKMSNGE